MRWPPPADVPVVSPMPAGAAHAQVRARAGAAGHACACLQGVAGLRILAETAALDMHAGSLRRVIFAFEVGEGHLEDAQLDGFG